MRIRFTKMEGCGNDYVYVNGFEQSVESPEKLACEISDRHFGVGSDGLVLILPSRKADIRMRMFNSDGSEAEMCGNAARCVARFAYEKGLVGKKEFVLETKAGLRPVELHLEHGEIKRITVDMGEPSLASADIPVLSDYYTVVDEPIELFGGEKRRITCVSMGNPHAVLFVDSIDRVDVAGVGKQIEHHCIFPARTNVEFVEVLSSHQLKMRVWERGAGETLACGTGACASLVAAALNQKADRKAVVHLTGGDLEIEWRESDSHVYMSGEARFVFEGEFYGTSGRGTMA